MSTKISALPASAGLTLTDIFPVVDDPGGVPVTQKATFSQLATLLGTGNFVLKAGDTMTGALVHPAGAVGTPSITFTGDLDTGIYHPAANILGLSAGGIRAAEFGPAAVDFGPAGGYIVQVPLGMLFIADNDGNATISATAGIALSLHSGVAGVFPTVTIDDDGSASVFNVFSNGAITIGSFTASSVSINSDSFSAGTYSSSQSAQSAQFLNVRLDVRNDDTGYFLCIFDSSPATGGVAGELSFFGGLGGLGSKFGQQSSGVQLTNNVTAGGTTNTIDDFTDLVIYANDATTIRDNIYQLAEVLGQIQLALRKYGLLAT